MNAERRSEVGIGDGERCRKRSKAELKSLEQRDRSNFER